MTETREFRSLMPVSPADLYAWHARPGAFQRLQPPWERVELLEHTSDITDGARARLRVHAGPFRLSWTARHQGTEPGRRFVDVQERGPFALWCHEHECAADPGGNPDASELIDRVTYQLPGGLLGHWCGGGYVRRKLERMFRYRHAVTRGDLEYWRNTRDVPRLNIAITGASGLVGTALTAFLTTQGHDVVRLSRSAGPGFVRWDPARHVLDRDALRGVDAVIHLAGANLASGRWNDARKREFFASRVDVTRWLVDELAQLEPRPRIFLGASATGYYGDTGDVAMDETNGPGTGYLADLCAAWEAETKCAESWGARVVSMRLGVVLSAAGGALAKLVPIFRAGLGGPLAGGRAWMSWIALDDVLGAVTYALGDTSLRGPVNLVAPDPVTNADFTRALARATHRPAFVPVPGWALRVAVGEFAEAALLASSRIRPTRLAASGYTFRHPDLATALRHELGG